MFRRRRLWLVLLLFVLPVFGLARCDVGQLVRPRLLAGLPALEARLGRPVRVGALHLHLLPPRASLEDLVIAAPAGAPPGDGPLWSARAVRVRLALWPLVRSLGQQVEIESLEIDGPVLHLVRFADGKLSAADVVARLRASPTAPLSPAQLARLSRARLGHLWVRDAALRLEDRRAGETAAIEHLRLHAADVALARVFTLEIDAAVLAAQENFHIEARIGPLPRDLDFERPLLLVQKAGLRLLPAKLGPLLRFFAPPAGLRLDQATAAASLSLELPAAAGQVRAAGQAELLGLVLQDGSGAGQPTDLRLVLDLMLDPLAGMVQSRALHLRIGEMGVGLVADLRHLHTAPEVHALSLRGEDLRLERMVALLPPGRRPGGVVRGPVALDLSASGPKDAPELRFDLDLGAADLLLPTLHKPAGVALAVEMHAQVRDHALLLERLGVTLGPLALSMRGAVRGPEDLDLRLTSGVVPIAPLLSLVPPARRALPAGMPIDQGKGGASGTVDLSGDLKIDGGGLAAHAAAQVRDARVALNGLALGGDLLLSMALRGGAAGESLHAAADLRGARIFAAGVLDKPAGTPLKLTLAGTRSGRRVTVERADLEVPGGTLRGSYVEDPAAHRLEARVGPVDVDLAQLLRVAPVLRARLGGWALSRLRLGQGVLRRDGSDWGAARATVEGLELGVAGGRLRGRAEVTGLDGRPPRQIGFALEGEELDLDALWAASRRSGATASGSPGEVSPVPAAPAAPAPAAPAPPAPASAAPAGAASALAATEGSGTLHLSGGRLGGAPLREVHFDGSLRRGIWQMKTLRLRALGGSVDASGSSGDLSQRPPRYRAQVRLDGLDLDQLGALAGPPPEGTPQASGHLSGQIDLQGWVGPLAQVAQHTQGDVSLRLTDFSVRNASLEVVLLNPLLQRAQTRGLRSQPGKDAAGGAAKGTAMRNVSLRGRVVAGRIQLREPLRFENDDAQASFTGSIGLDRSVSLSGEVQIAPEAIERATQGRLSPRGPVPVGVRLSGVMPRVEVELVEIQRALGALAGSVLRGRFRQIFSPPAAPPAAPPPQPQAP